MDRKKKQRWEESEKIREEERERVRRKKLQVREKVGKSRNTVFFQWFEAPEGRKVGSLKRRVRSQRARWEMKIARRCGAKHISKSNVITKQLSFGALLEVAMSKKCTPLWRKAHLQVKKLKAHHIRITFGSWDVEKLNAVVTRSTFRSQNVKNTTCSDHFLDVQMLVRVAGARDCAPSQKWAKREGFVAFPETMAGVGHLKRICKDAFRVAGAVHGSTKDMFIRDVRRSGRLFPEKGCILEHQIFRFADTILHDRCSTSYDLASLFRGRRSTLDRWSGKIAKRIGRGRQLCTQLSMFEGSLAELFHCWCCQLRKLRKSRRIASFSSLQVDRQADKQIDRWIDRLY